MHAIQTSGNCIRNVTADHFAGVAADEIDDPRPYAEILRQWSTLHPEFSFLPRKFKIAVTGARARPRRRSRCTTSACRSCATTRARSASRSMSAAASAARRSSATRSATSCRERDLLAYLEAILRVYNRYGRRDNKYKARIKILRAREGHRGVARRGRGRVRRARPRASLDLPAEEIARIAAYFAPPPLERAAGRASGVERAARRGRALRQASSTSNVVAAQGAGLRHRHRVAEADRRRPGDASAEQMDAVADLAERLFARRDARLARAEPRSCRMWSSTICRRSTTGSASVGLATPNAGLITDIIACPGLDYCALATARSIPIAQRISRALRRRRARAARSAPLKIKISGCINACGHHHVGHIGILGLEQEGRGDLPDHARRLGRRDRRRSARSSAPASARRPSSSAVETIVDTYHGAPQRAETRPSSTPIRRVGIGAVQGGALRAQRRSRHLMSAHDVKLFGDADRRLAARRPLRQASRRARCCGWRSRTCSPAASRWCRASAPTPPCCCTWSRRSTRRRRSSSSTPASISPRRSPIATSSCAPLGLTNVDRRRARRRGHGGRGPGEVAVRQRSRPLLRHPQGAAARRARSTASTPGSPAARASRARRARRLPLFEAEGERVKVNPLVGWSATDVLDYIRDAGLPPHPLVAKGFPSIGCLPCTSRGRARRGPARRPLARPRQDRMRHPRRAADAGQDI